MRVPVVTSDRIRDWFSNTQKTNTMVVDPIEAELDEEKKTTKEAFAQLQQAYEHMMKVASPLSAFRTDASER